MIPDKFVLIEYVGADNKPLTKRMEGGERMGYEFMSETKTGMNFLKVYSDNDTLFVPLHRVISVQMSL